MTEYSSRKFPAFFLSNINVGQFSFLELVLLVYASVLFQSYFVRYDLHVIKYSDLKYTPQ